MSRTKHRRRKTAAKCHMVLDTQSFLPRFAIVKSANSHDGVDCICRAYLTAAVDRTGASTIGNAASAALFTAICRLICGTACGTIPMNVKENVSTW